MKLVRLMNFPAHYQAHYFAARPDVEGQSYDVLRRALFDDAFSFGDAWEGALRDEGLDAVDIPFGVPQLDRAFARDVGLPAMGPLETAIAQLRKHQPEVLYLSSLESWTPEDIIALRQSVPSIRGVLGMAGIDISYSPSLREVDVFLTCIRNQATRLREGGMEASFMAHAFDPRVLTRLEEVPREGFKFLGGFVSGPHYHDERRIILEGLVHRCGLEIYSDGGHRASQSLSRYLAQTAAFAVGRTLRLVPASYGLVPFGDKLRQAGEWEHPPRPPGRPLPAKALHPPLYGMEMYRGLNATRLSINIHSGASGAFGANMRLFEATGAGVCLMADAKADLHEFFEPGEEVVEFSGLEDAVRKATELLADPARMEEIGARGRRRILRDHTYAHRAPVVARAALTALEMGTRRRGAPR